jgi:hypothetical protein
MKNVMNERYDEIKSLVKKAKLLNEQLNAEKLGQINVATDIEDKIDDDVASITTSTLKTGGESQLSTLNPQEAQEEFETKYRISGNILALHGPTKSSTDITTDDKIAFQDSIEEFNNEVSDLVEFNQLNVYTNTVEWSGKIIDKDFEFLYTIGESSGVYIDGVLIKLDEETKNLIDKLFDYYGKFKARWAKVLAIRKQVGYDDKF